MNEYPTIPKMHLVSFFWTRTVGCFKLILMNIYLTLSGLISLFCGAFVSSAGSENYCLIYSLEESQITNADQIISFMREPRLSLELEDRTQFIVWSRHSKASDNSRLLFSKNPLLKLILLNTTRFEKLKLLTSILSLYVQLWFRFDFWKILFFPQLTIEMTLVDFLSHKCVKYKLITTQTHLKRLPAAFYFQDELQKRRHMIWYSDNSWVVSKQGDSREFDNSRYLRDMIDVHWCWTKSWKAHLTKLRVPGEINAVGSLLFYPTSFVENYGKEIYDIVIFDVNPSPQGYEYNFYANEAIDAFYDSILSTIRLLRNEFPSLRVAVKHKREINKQLHTRLGQETISNVDPNSNLYNLISNAKISLGIPFVSPIYISRELAKPGAFFYPDLRNQWNLPKIYEGINVFKDQKNLVRWIRKELQLEPHPLHIEE
jgi:polysaccharide biosynthesis PFTS motif protein